MHIIKSGYVEVNGKTASGQILITESDVFAFHNRSNAAMTGQSDGGLVGALIGRFIDLRRAKNALPEHLNHSEIIGLDQSTRKKLITTELLCTIPLKNGLTAEEINGGLTFRADGYPNIEYLGLFHKKAVVDFLRQRSIPIIA